MRPLNLMFVSILVLITALSASAKVIYVDSDSAGLAIDGMTWSTAYHRVQDAINMAMSGDDIQVATGTYVEQLVLKSGVDLFGGYVLTIINGQVASVQRPWKSMSVLDGCSQGTVVTCNVSNTAYQCLDGFVITNGKLADLCIAQGGGVCVLSGKLVINNCKITGNEALDGGGIFSSSPDLAVFNTSITGNKAVCSGGGIYSSVNVLNVPPIVACCVFDGNTANEGAAVYVGCPSGSFPGLHLLNNTVVRNSANVADGAAIFFDAPGGKYIAWNNIIVFNTAGIRIDSAAPVAYNCLFNNRDYATRGFALSSSNIVCDPKLANIAAADYHLLSDSPCIDRGSSTVSNVVAPALKMYFTDMDGSRRAMGLGPDMGADEILPVIRVSITGNDLNTGLSWQQAMRTVRAAIFKYTANSSSPVRGLGDRLEIWVGAGGYSNSDFHSGPEFTEGNIELYGGFAGTETQRTQRDWVKNLTKITGGISYNPIDVTSPFRFDGFTLSNTGGHGITCLAGDNTIANNQIIECKYSGVCVREKTSPEGTQAYASANITNNTISSNNTAQSLSSAGVWCSAKSAVLEGNIISNNACYGVVAKTRDSATVTLKRNVISQTIRTTGIGSGSALETYEYSSVSAINNSMLDNTYGIFVYSTGSPSGRLTAQYNTIANSPVKPGNFGISASSIQFTAVGNIVTYNRIMGIAGPSPKQSTVSGNCFYNPGGRNYPYVLDNTNILLDPKFTDPAAGNYHLLPGSPCIDAGISAGAPDVDIEGNPRPKDGNADGVAGFDIGCYECPANYVSMSKLKTLRDGSPVGITDVVATTSALPGRFYVETPNRISGIGILGSVGSAGRRVSVEGTIATLDGEKVIMPTWIGDNGPASTPKPWYVNYNALGGGRIGLQAGVQDWRMVKKIDKYGKPYMARVLTTYGGANNIGLLVKMTGRLTSNSGSGCFYLDGAAAFDGGVIGIKGIEVDWPFATPAPTNGSLVSIVGISSCRIVHDNAAGDVIVRLLRPVSADAVVVY